jgi:hypothetical protein
LQDLPPRHFVLKVRGHKVKVGKTLHLPEPRVEPKELLEVEQEYLRRYFRSKQEIEPAWQEPQKQPLPLYQPSQTQQLIPMESGPTNRRERLR